MTTYLLDSNVLSEPLKPEPNMRVLQRLEAEWSRCVVPAVVWHELVFGLENLGPSRRREVISSWLFDTIEPSFPIVAYGAAEARWHARARAHLKRRGRVLPVIDGQIAATAAANELVLVTRNTRDFEPFERLQVENWFG